MKKQFLSIMLLTSLCAPSVQATTTFMEALALEVAQNPLDAGAAELLKALQAEAAKVVAKNAFATFTDGTSKALEVVAPMATKLVVDKGLEELKKAVLDEVTKNPLDKGAKELLNYLTGGSVTIPLPLSSSAPVVGSLVSESIGDLSGNAFGVFTDSTGEALNSVAPMIGDAGSTVTNSTLSGVAAPQFNLGSILSEYVSKKSSSLMSSMVVPKELKGMYASGLNFVNEAIKFSVDNYGVVKSNPQDYALNIAKKGYEVAKEHPVETAVVAAAVTAVAAGVGYGMYRFFKSVPKQQASVEDLFVTFINEKVLNSATAVGSDRIMGEFKRIYALQNDGKLAITKYDINACIENTKFKFQKYLSKDETTGKHNYGEISTEEQTVLNSMKYNQSELYKAMLRVLIARDTFQKFSAAGKNDDAKKANELSTKLKAELQTILNGLKKN